MKKIISVIVLFSTSFPILVFGCELGFTEGWRCYGDLCHNECFSCDLVSAIHLVQKGNDSACPNREIIKTKYNDEYSILKECPKEYPLKTLQGCRKCDEKYVFTLLNKLDNDVCPERTVQENEEGLISIFSCPQDRPLKLKAKIRSEFDVLEEGCYPCDLLDTRILIDPENDKDVCPNRETLSYGRTVLKQCPPEAPLKTSEGCRTCDDKGDFHVQSKEDCDVCPDREIWGGEYGPMYCSIKCPSDKPMRGLDMTAQLSCYSCDSPEKSEEGIFWVTFNESECNKCSQNRYYDHKREYCGYKKSPVSGFPLESIFSKTKYVKYARFYSCDEKILVETTPENCALCPNREYKNGNCYFKCPDSFVFDWNEGCISCNTKKELSAVRGDDCLRCPNRKMKDFKSKCVLKNDLWTKTKLFFSSLFDKEDLK